jgi:hypothetical protein
MKRNKPQIFLTQGDRNHCGGKPDQGGHWITDKSPFPVLWLSWMYFQLLLLGCFCRTMFSLARLHCPWRVPAAVLFCLCWGLCASSVAVIKGIIAIPAHPKPSMFPSPAILLCVCFPLFLLSLSGLVIVFSRLYSFYPILMNDRAPNTISKTSKNVRYPNTMTIHDSAN